MDSIFVSIYGGGLSGRDAAGSRAPLKGAPDPAATGTYIYKQIYIYIYIYIYI